MLLRRRQAFLLSLSKRRFLEKLAVASEDVVLHLVDSKCMPILLYATEVCPLSLSDIRSLDFAIFRFLMKLFKTNNKEIIK